MGPNSINNFSTASAAAMATGQPAAKTNTDAAVTASDMKINYGDSTKAERLQAGLRSLQSAYAQTGLFIRTINPDLGKL